MKKLLAVTLFVVMLASAQTPTVKPGLLLTEVETLQISIVMKDLLILQLSINNLNARFQTLTNRQTSMQAGLDRMVERLRVVHEAPADKFEFNAATLKFVPLPTKEPPK